jgi:hypothetical protein
MKPKLCVHCSNPRFPVNRPRGLCWRCYYTPGVKELHAPISYHGRRGEGGRNSHSPLDPNPTQTAPYSLEREAVYAFRAAAGYAIKHPEDRAYASQL